MTDVNDGVGVVENERIRGVSGRPGNVYLNTS